MNDKRLDGAAHAPDFEKLLAVSKRLALNIPDTWPAHYRQDGIDGRIDGSLTDRHPSDDLVVARSRWTDLTISLMRDGWTLDTMLDNLAVVPLEWMNLTVQLVVAGLPLYKLAAELAPQSAHPPVTTNPER